MNRHISMFSMIALVACSSSSSPTDSRNDAGPKTAPGMNFPGVPDAGVDSSISNPREPMDAGTDGTFTVNVFDAGSDSSSNFVDAGSVQDASPDVASGCMLRTTGTYVENFVIRSGNCGNQTEAVFTINTMSGSMTPSACVDNGSMSADNCTVNINVVCPTPALGVGYTASEMGDAVWNEAGTMATGVISLSVADANGVDLCAGTYNITITKQ